MQSIKNILVPTDFSPASWEATHYALELCKKHGANMTLFHIVPGKNNSQTRQLEHMSKKLQSLTHELNKSEKKDLIRPVAISGKIPDEILKHLQDHQYDLVVMGINGNGGLNKEMGTNARFIVENSDVPVRVVPNKREDY